MKEDRPAAQEVQVEPEVTEDHEISFAETQSFHFWSNDKESSEKPEEIKPEEVQVEPSEDIPSEIHNVKDEAVEETVPEVQTAWKPMSLEANMPDSLINKSLESVTPVADTAVITEVPSAEAKEKTEIVEEPKAIAELPAEDHSVEELITEQPKKLKKYREFRKRFKKMRKFR